MNTENFDELKAKMLLQKQTPTVKTENFKKDGLLENYMNKKIVDASTGKQLLREQKYEG